MEKYHHWYIGSLSANPIQAMCGAHVSQHDVMRDTDGDVIGFFERAGTQCPECVAMMRAKRVANQDQESTDMEDRNYESTQQRPPRQDLRKDHAPNRDKDIDKEKMEKRDDMGGTSVYQKKKGEAQEGGGETVGESTGRNLTEFKPEKEDLVALMKVEEKLNICLKFMSGAMSDFYALKSIDISPDGKLGGRGYVMEMAEVRGKLYQSVENISAIIDTIYDEICGDHWMALFNPEIDAQFEQMKNPEMPEESPEEVDDLGEENVEKVSSILEHVKKIAAETGPRGGKIIGETKSGKPIYDTHDHSAHKDFNKKDHIDAGKAQDKLSTEAYLKGDLEKSKIHGKQRDEHNYNAYHGGKPSDLAVREQKKDNDLAKKEKEKGFDKGYSKKPQDESLHEDDE